MPQTISQYLIESLHKYNVHHVFGVPGDFVLRFYKDLEDSSLTLVNTVDELGAGFAADAYARLRGMGAVCVTYGVGGFKVTNSTAQAFAEKSPVVIISGAPGVAEQRNNPMLHHKSKRFESQRIVFDELTVATAVLNDRHTAFDEIDRVLHACFQLKGPVYIELPRDMGEKFGSSHHLARDYRAYPDPKTVEEGLEEAYRMIRAAKHPVIIAGVEIHRYDLQGIFLHFVEKTKIPVATTLMSKSVISDLHPLALGLYAGKACREELRAYVESSDCILMLGAFLSDLDSGIFTDNLSHCPCIVATGDKVIVKHHIYPDFPLEMFLTGLNDRAFFLSSVAKMPEIFYPKKTDFDADARLTIQSIIPILNDSLTDNTAVIADVGDALFSAMDLRVHGQTLFLAPSYYASLGFAIPASVGVQMANPTLRPLIVMGDGSLQMSAVELSTVVRYGGNPIIILLNNRGYGTERPMIDGDFNDVHNWVYTDLPKVFGSGKAVLATTCRELESALIEASLYTDSFFLIECTICRDDYSPTLRRLTEALAKRICSDKISENDLGGLSGGAGGGGILFADN